MRWMGVTVKGTQISFRNIEAADCKDSAASIFLKDKSRLLGWKKDLQLKNPSLLPPLSIQGVPGTYYVWWGGLWGAKKRWSMAICFIVSLCLCRFYFISCIYLNSSQRAQSHKQGEDKWSCWLGRFGNTSLLQYQCFPNDKNSLAEG